MSNSVSLKSEATWVIESPSMKLRFTVNEEYQAPNKHKAEMNFGDESSGMIQIADICYESINWEGETEVNQIEEN